MQSAASAEPPDAAGEIGALSWQVPPALVVGVIALASGIALRDALALYLVTHPPTTIDGFADHLADQQRLALAGPALAIAASTVALSGALALRRLAEPSRWWHAVWLGVLAILLGHLVPAFAPRAWIGLYRASRLESDLPAIGVALLAIGALALGWASRRVRFAAVPLLLAAVATFPPSALQPGLQSLLWAWRGVESDLGRWWWWTAVHAAGALGFAALTVAVLVAALRRRPLRATRTWARAAGGFRWAGWSLVAHVAVAVAAGAVALIATVEQSRGLFRSWSVGLPLGFVLVGTNLGIALLYAADLVGVRAPRARLCAAAGVVLWAVTLQALQLAAALEVRPVDRGAADQVLLLLWSAKIVAGALAAGCLIAAIATIAARMHMRVTPRAAIATAWLFGGGALLAGIGTQVALGLIRARGGGVGPGAIAAVGVAGAASLTALLAIAILTLRLARDLEIAARAHAP